MVNEKRGAVICMIIVITIPVFVGMIVLFQFKVKSKKRETYYVSIAHILL